MKIIYRISDGGYNKLKTGLCHKTWHIFAFFENI